MGWFNFSGTLRSLHQRGVRYRQLRERLQGANNVGVGAGTPGKVLHVSG